MEESQNKPENKHYTKHIKQDHRKQTQVEETSPVKKLKTTSRVDRLRGDTCPHVCPQTGLN